VSSPHSEPEIALRRRIQREGPAPVKILYVEDDPIAREFVSKGLRRNGYVVDVAPDDDTGFQRAAFGRYDLIVLDVMLPDADGFDILREVRGLGVKTPVLFLSARGDVEDRIRGLDLGADDYIPKPFAFAELLSRIRAITRRRTGVPSDGRLVLEDLVLDTRRVSVERAGRRIDLTPKQFGILELLLRNVGIPLSRSQILEEVWGFGFETQEGAIDVHITALRKKIDAGFARPLIHTVKGVGYVADLRAHADPMTGQGG
jgi:two-component system copper resistance phosphate regulon response regulator CusR